MSEGARFARALALSAVCSVWLTSCDANKSWKDRTFARAVDGAQRDAGVLGTAGTAPTPTHAKPDVADKDLPCLPAVSSDHLRPRSSAIATHGGMTTTGEAGVFTRDLFARFQSNCGGCHVDQAQGGLHVSVNDFAQTLPMQALDRIMSDDPSYFMPPGPPRGNGQPFSKRGKDDPIVELAGLLEAWFAAGKPADIFYPNGAATQAATVSYLLPPDVAMQMTNLGNCVPDKVMVGIEETKSAELDSMFEKAAELPERLEQTDLYTLDSKELAKDGVVAFAPAYTLWADNAKKIRMVRAPRGQTIAFDKDSQTFSIPANTRFYKTFLKHVVDLDGNESYRKIETRLILSRPDTINPDGSRTPNALFGTYAWNEKETEAVLVRDPLRNGTPFRDRLLTYITDEQKADAVIADGPADLGKALEKAGVTRTYAIPGSERCIQCHMGSPSASFILGFIPLQIHRRPSGQGGVIEAAERDELNQLQRLIDYGIISGMTSPDEVTLLEDSQGKRKPRNTHELEAQGYMLGNCAHCHNPYGFPSVTAPELRDLLSFMPSPGHGEAGPSEGGGIFQFPLDKASPRIFRGANQKTPIPYISPSLHDLNDSVYIAHKSKSPGTLEMSFSLSSGVTIDSVHWQRWLHKLDVDGGPVIDNKSRSDTGEGDIPVMGNSLPFNQFANFSATALPYSVYLSATTSTGVQCSVRSPEFQVTEDGVSLYAGASGPAQQPGAGTGGSGPAQQPDAGTDAGASPNFEIALNLDCGSDGHALGKLIFSSSQQSAYASQRAGITYTSLKPDGTVVEELLGVSTSSSIPQFPFDPSAVGAVSAPVVLTSFLRAPWRSLIYRNVDTPFAYVDDDAIFPHMPRNTPGYDCRARRLLGAWMASIPARLKPELEAGFLTDVAAGADPDAAEVKAAAGELQPYVEVTPDDRDFSFYERNANFRVEDFQASPRYTDCPTGAPSHLPDDPPFDIQDPRVRDNPGDPNLLSPSPVDVNDGNVQYRLQSSVDPSWFVPERPHWFVTDNTEPPGDWFPRRADWHDIIVDHREDLYRTGEKQLVDLLATVKVTDNAELAAFALTDVHFGTWVEKKGCEFPPDKVKKVAEVAANERPDWMTIPDNKISEDAHVYDISPGAQVFTMICRNCHGPHADAKSRLADTIADLTGGDTRVANLRDGLLGPISAPGDNRQRVFGDAGGGFTADDWAGRYLAWMTLGGTKRVIPPVILNLIRNIPVLGEHRGGNRAFPTTTANMLMLAKFLCEDVLPTGTGYLDPVKGSIIPETPTGGGTPSALISKNGDREMWQRLCALQNPLPVRALTFDPHPSKAAEQFKIITSTAGTSDMPIRLHDLFHREGYGSAPVGDDQGRVRQALDSANLEPWCIRKPTASDALTALEQYWAASMPAGSAPPYCPDNALAESNRMTEDQLASWTQRGAMNAGLSVFLYLDALAKGDKQPPLAYDDCEHLPK